MREIKPDDNFYVELKKGRIHIVGEKKTETYGKSRLSLGREVKPEKSGFVRIYYIELDNLRKIMNNRFPFVYHRVPYNIKARESLWGELEVKIKEDESGLIFKSKVVFSRKEYDIIREYMDALDNTKKPKITREYLECSAEL